MDASPSSKDKEKPLVEESFKTKKAREKLRRRLEDMDAQVTKEALNKKSVEIHRWISRNANGRLSLRDKKISLFDENENAAEVSLRVAKIAEQLQKGELPE